MRSEGRYVWYRRVPKGLMTEGCLDLPVMSKLSCYLASSPTMTKSTSTSDHPNRLTPLHLTILWMILDKVLMFHPRSVKKHQTNKNIICFCKVKYHMEMLRPKRRATFANMRTPYTFPTFFSIKPKYLLFFEVNLHSSNSFC